MSARAAALSFLITVLVASAAHAAEPMRPRDRADARAIVRELRRIVVPEGIEESRTVRIGGIDQAITIRGYDRKNPVLLFLHGGPGFVAMPSSWWFSKPWEEYFTVVHWDQRGAGKTYALNDPATVAPTLTIERMTEDTIELIAYLRRELGHERVVLVGHSWGSFLGLRVAQAKPEWLHAYVGLAQASDVRESERRGYAWTLAQAKARKDAKAIAELEAIAPYAEGDAPLELAKIGVQRRWLNRYGGAVHRRADAATFEVDAGYLSPDYTDADLAVRDDANEASESALLATVLSQDLSNVKRLEVPIVLFLGRHDVNLSSTAAAEWLDTVSAPAKSIVWFERSAHEMMLEEPGKTLVSLVDVVRPYALRADPR